MFLILIVNLLIVAIGFLVTRKSIKKLLTRIILWFVIFGVLVILEFIIINKLISDYYSKQHHLNREELSRLLNNVQENLEEKQQKSFASADLVFEGYPLRIEKFDKSREQIYSAVDMTSKTQHLKANSLDYKFVVVFNVEKLIKGKFEAATFSVLVQNPEMTFAFAGFDIKKDGTINTKIPFRIYINSQKEMIYNHMSLYVTK